MEIGEGNTGYCFAWVVMGRRAQEVTMHGTGETEPDGQHGGGFGRVVSQGDGSL